jgi:hypothetical protein
MEYEIESIDSAPRIVPAVLL